MPFEKKWIVSWGHFFEIDGSKPNLSRRIGPQFSPDFQKPEHFGPIDDAEDGGKLGLTYRDLLGGGFLHLWSAQGLIDAVGKNNRQLIDESALLKGNSYRERMREYLAVTQREEHYPTDKDVDALMNSTPLAFFVLFEAAADPDTPGLRLGLLGSIIVAEVILAAMTRDPVFGESGAQSLAAALEALSMRTFGRSCLGDVGEIASMPELIKFVAKSRRPGEDDPVFI
jgi:hypothetical protein